MAELPSRFEHEEALAKALGKLGLRHRRELLALVGTPPDLAKVPDSFWERIDRETREALIVILLLIFAESAELHGMDKLTAATVAPQWVAGRMETFGPQYIANSRETMRKAADKAGEQFYSDAEPPEPIARPSTGPSSPPAIFKAAATEVFVGNRPGRVAQFEAALAMNEGGQVAVDQLVETGVTVTTYWRHSQLRSERPPHHSNAPVEPCKICSPWEDTDSSQWPIVDGEKLQPPAHCGCDCWKQYIEDLTGRKIGEDVSESVRESNANHRPAGDEHGGEFAPGHGGASGGGTGRVVFHATNKAGAKSLETSGIDSGSLNQRDSGFFGPGFYTSHEPQDFYGKSVVALHLKPGAKVLDVGELRPDAPQAWHGEFIDSLTRRIKAHRPNIEPAKLQAITDAVTPGSPTFSHIEYAQEVGGFARSEGYDAVAFAGGQETVVLNAGAVEHVKHVGGLAKAQAYRKAHDAKAAQAKPQHVTDTPAFKAWFGDSKVVDEHGKPLVVYHGTSDAIDEFDLNHGNRKDTGWLGTGVYATTDPGIAGSYASMKAGRAGQNILPLYAAVKNPYIATIDDKRRLQNISNMQGQAAGRDASDAWTRELIAKGHDGVILQFPKSMLGPESKEIVIFNPAAVKSATGNRGTFDPKSPKITESVAA